LNQFLDFVRLKTKPFGFLGENLTTLSRLGEFLGDNPENGRKIPDRFALPAESLFCWCACTPHQNRNLSKKPLPKAFQTCHTTPYGSLTWQKGLTNQWKNDT